MTPEEFQMMTPDERAAYWRKIRIWGHPLANEPNPKALADLPHGEFRKLVRTYDRFWGTYKEAKPSRRYALRKAASKHKKDEKCQ